jgi:hypothetical protein
VILKCQDKERLHVKVPEVLAIGAATRANDRGSIFVVLVRQTGISSLGATFKGYNRVTKSLLLRADA